MTYRGKIKNGLVVLDKRAPLPEGASVSVRVLKPARRPAGKGQKRPATLYDGLKPFIGMAAGLPPDGSRNVDLYLYGAPKRK